MIEDNVVSFGGQTKLPISVERVLTEAVRENLERVIVIGEYEDGTPYYAGSEACAAINNWLADRFKFQLQVIADGNDP